MWGVPDLRLLILYMAYGALLSELGAEPIVSHINIYYYYNGPVRRQQRVQQLYTDHNVAATSTLLTAQRIQEEHGSSSMGLPAWVFKTSP